MPKWFHLLWFLSLWPGRMNAQPRTDAWLQQLLVQKGDSLMQWVLSQPDTFQYQIIYTRIDRNSSNKPLFTNFYFNADKERYFNPASTVKLPTALMALEKLNRFRHRGVDRNTTMITDSSYERQTAVLSDSTAENGKPSVAHYIRKIFLVSDNDAYNRLYEFVGQEEMNRLLQHKGYRDVRITRRFVSMNEEQNRHTNGIRFVKGDSLLHYQRPAVSKFSFDFSKKYLVGRAHWDRNDSLINEPMDFTTHNRLPLEDLHTMVQSLVFPFQVPARKKFLLTEDDRRFVLDCMSRLPSESLFPRYDTTVFFDSYTKFFFKAGRQKPPPGVRLFNKTGWSYGYLTDAAYVLDTVNKVDFFLSAVIYVNADGVLNDNRYEYEKIGYPFFRELFRIIYEYEKARKAKQVPNFSQIRSQ